MAMVRVWVVKFDTVGGHQVGDETVEARTAAEALSMAVQRTRGQVGGGMKNVISVEKVAET